jgi:hypothetical protein
MTIETLIANIVKDVLYECLSNPQVFLKKINMAKKLDISTDQLDRLVQKRILIEQIHFTRFIEGGVPMFFVSEVVEALKPENAKTKIVL